MALQPAAVMVVPPDDELTEDMVRNYIDYGQLTARFPSRSEGWSDAYTMIQFIYRIDGRIVKHWFRCSHCGKTWKVFCARGTKPLLRHKQTHINEEKKALEQATVTEAIPEKAIDTAPTDASSQPLPNAVLPTPPVQQKSVEVEVATEFQPERESISLDRRRMISLLSEMSMIGCKFGPVNRKDIEEWFPKGDGQNWNSDEFLVKAEDIAKQRAGITEPRVVLHKIIPQSELCAGNGHGDGAKAKKIATAKAKSTSSANPPRMQTRSKKQN